MSFCHLNVCSDFSLQESTVKIKQMVSHAVKNSQPAIALTDMSNLFGAVEFYSACMSSGVKPIMGCTFYVCENHKDKSSEKYKRYTKLPRVTLLAKNNVGWKNLMKLSSVSFIDGFYYLPRIDHELLRNHSEGLFALSGGWFGEVESYLKVNDTSAAEKAYSFYSEVFGEDFFFEIQRQDIEGQKDLNNSVVDFANKFRVNVVATNPARFNEEDDFESFKAVVALKSKRTVHDEVLGDYNDSFYLKGTKTIQELFKDIPSAISNTVYIANRCNVQLEFGNYQMPDFELPEGVDINEYVTSIAHSGLEKNWNKILVNNLEADKKEYLLRLHTELETLKKMGFLGYFLVVSDFIQWAKNNDIPVGPGRGSGAGSLVAYSLGITDLDPIRYGLLFERFLNPERVSMPDFDIDFCKERREEVIRYVEKKYGSAKVSQIINFGTMKAKAAVRDIGRVFDISYDRIDYLAKLIPEDLDVNLTNALEREPRLADFIKEDEEIASVYDAARKVEGNHRHAGKHAAGVVIGKYDLVESAPLYKVPDEEGTVVQWDMKSAEKSGLIKFDFLGLKTLTVIDKAVKLIRRKEKDFDIGVIPMDCHKTFALLQSGKTSSVFQLESEGMQRVLVELCPDCFEDLIALVALYRPGPLESGMVSDFIDRKHGRAIVEYPHPLLEQVLEETNGVIVYQEQVMQIAQILSGYTLGGADLLRRAMGKKKPEEMAKQRSVFVEGATKNNIAPETSGYIFDLIEMFAGYGFNKSHSAAYALLTYQTAYLKANYPYEFMSASMTCDSSDDDKLRTLIYDTRGMGINVVYPDVNRSEFEFSISEGNILTGLCSIKGLGESVARVIVAERKIKPFDSIEDLIARTNINKKAIEVLVKSGALDFIEDNREFVLANIPVFVKKAKNINDDKDSGQFSMFADVESLETYEFVNVDRIDIVSQLDYEKEVYGFYLGNHPAGMISSITDNIFDFNSSNLDKVEIDDKFYVIGTIDAVKIIRRDNGDMAIVSVSDEYGHYECVCFAKNYERLGNGIETGKTFVFELKKNKYNDRVSYLLENLREPFKYIEGIHDNVFIYMDKKLVDKHEILNSFLKMNRKGVNVKFFLKLDNGSIAELLCNDKRKISCEDAFSLIRLGFDIKFCYHQ